MEDIGEPQDSIVTSTNDSEDCKAAVSELSDLIESLNTDERRPRRTNSASSHTSHKKVDESLPWYPNYLRLSLTIIGTSNLKALQNVISFFHHNISRDVKDAYMRPNRAAKVKILLSEALIHFHMCFSEIRLPLEQDTYLDQMTDLVAMYIDMELKASRRGKESTKKVSSKLSSSLFTFLNSSVDHILDSVLKSRFIVKSFSEICVPLLKKILTPPFQQMYEMTYVRYVLAFKLWKRITTDLEEKKKISNIASSIIPPPRLEEMLQEGLLHAILPPLRKNKKKLPLTLFFVTNKVNLKETIKEFMKFYRNTQHNDIAAAFDKSRFFKEQRNETNGSDVKDGSTELIDSIWTAFSSSSPVAQDTSNKSDSVCNNKDKKSRKKDILKNDKKNEKKRKSKNGKHTKKKLKKKKKKKKKKKEKDKLSKKKNKNFKKLSAKEIGKASKDIIFPVVNNVKEIHLSDITVEKKESVDNKEDPFIKNFLNTINTFKEDDSFLECKEVDIRNKIADSKENECLKNSTEKKETTTSNNNVITCKPLAGLKETNSNDRSENDTATQEHFDKVAITNFNILKMKSDFLNFKNSIISKSAVTSGETLHVTSTDLTSNHGDSFVEKESNESSVTNEANSDTEKTYSSFPYKVSDTLENKESNVAEREEHVSQKNDMSEVNNKDAKGETCNAEVTLHAKTSSDIISHSKLNFTHTVCDNKTDISMEINIESQDDVLCTESKEEISDRSLVVSNSQQQITVTSKQDIESILSEPLCTTVSMPIENCEPKEIDSNRRDTKIGQCLSYSLKELRIEESVTNCSHKDRDNLEMIKNNENNLLPNCEDKKGKMTDCIDQPGSADVCAETQLLCNRNGVGFDSATESVRELTPLLSSSINKLSDKTFESVQNSTTDTSQDDDNSCNKMKPNQISKLMPVEKSPSKLIDETNITPLSNNSSKNTTISQSSNIEDSVTDDIYECRKRSAHVCEDISKSHSFKEFKVTNTISNLHNNCRLSTGSSEISEDKQHLHTPSVDYTKRYETENKKKNTCLSTVQKESSDSSINSIVCNEMINESSETLLDNSDCDMSVMEKLPQVEEVKTIERKVIDSGEADSENSKIIISDTDMSTSSKEQFSLKVLFTNEDAYSDTHMKKSCEKVSPSIEVDVTQAVSRTHTTDTATTEAKQNKLDHLKKGEKELPVLKIKEEKMDLLSNPQTPFSSHVEVTECVEKDMKTDVSTEQNISVINNSTNKATDICKDSVSYTKHQTRIENVTCNKTLIEGSKQTENRKQDDDKMNIPSDKQAASLNSDAQCLANKVTSRCNKTGFEGMPLSVYNMKTTKNITKDSCARPKVLLRISNNKITEVRSIEKLSANVFQDNNLDITTVEDTNKKFVSINTLISLRREEKNKTIGECVSRSGSALNTSQIIKKEDSIATHKAKVSDTQVESNNSKNDPISLETESCKTKLHSVHDRLKAETRHTSQEESLEFQVSSTSVSTQRQAKISLSNTVDSDHIVLPDPSDIDIAVEENKSKYKYRSGTERNLSGSKNAQITNEENENLDDCSVVPAEKNLVKNDHSSKSKSIADNDDTSNNLKPHNVDVASKKTENGKQTVIYPTNTEINKKICENSQDNEIHCNKLYKNKLYNTENPVTNRSSNCTDGTNDGIDSKEEPTDQSSGYKNSLYTVNETEKIKYRVTPISTNGQPAKKLQTNVDALLGSREVESHQNNKELIVVSSKLNVQNTQKNSSEKSIKPVSEERKEIVFQSATLDIKQKNEKLPESRGLRSKLCVNRKETEDKVSRGPNVESQNNSVWRMINLESHNTGSDKKNNSVHSEKPDYCLPQTSSSDRTFRLNENNGSNSDRESAKQPLACSKYEHYSAEDECSSTKSGKMCKTNLNTLDRKYVPVKDCSSSFKMKFVKVPIEKGMDETLDAAKQQKSFVGSGDVKICITKLDSESLHNKTKKSKSSSLRHHDNEQFDEQVNSLLSPHNTHIKTASLRVEEKNKKKLDKKSNKSLDICMWAKSVISEEMQLKTIITTPKESALHTDLTGNKSSDSSEKVNTLAGAYKKFNNLHPDLYNNEIKNSSETQYAEDIVYDGLPNVSKEINNMSQDPKPSKIKRKRKHSVRSHRKDHHSNNKSNVFNTKDAIPVLNLMKLPNNQWSDKAKLGLEPYVKLKKLTDHELLSLTNHTEESPVSHNSCSDYSDSKVELGSIHEHMSHEDCNKVQLKDPVEIKRAKLSATFIKVDQEWRIAEPAAITVEIQTEDKINKYVHTEKATSGINEIKSVHNPLQNIASSYHTDVSLNTINKSKINCDVNVQTDCSLNMLQKNVVSPHVPSTVNLKTCVLKNADSEKHQFISQPESDSYSMTQSAVIHNNSQNNMQHMENTSSLAQNNSIPNQLYIKRSLKDPTLRTDAPVHVSEVNEQNYIRELTSDTSLENSTVKLCKPQIQQSVKKVFLRKSTDQSSATSSPDYMPQVSLQSLPGAMSHNYSSYNDNMQTEIIKNKPRCQRLNEKDNYHLDSSTIVQNSTVNFGRCIEERQNEVNIAANSVVNNMTTIKNEFKMNSCNILGNSGSHNTKSSMNNCPESSSLQPSLLNPQPVLHDWTVSNPSVPETPLDYTVTQSQPVDSWTPLDSGSKTTNNDSHAGTSEIQDLSKLQPVSTDIKTYSEYVDRKLNEEKLNIHLQTVNSDYTVCCSQMKYKEYLSLNVSHSVSLPYPPQIPGDARHPVIRCCCQQCCRNYHVLINNYNKLVFYRSSKTAAGKKQREAEEIAIPLERDHSEPDSSLPLKKRKTLTQSTTENKIESYPNIPMISIAELEPANYSHYKRLIVPNPSVQLYSRLGTEPVSSQYVTRTSDWNFQNSSEDQNHLPAIPTEPNNLGHSLINFVAQNNASQYIVNGQEETARVKREMKRQKQSLRRDWQICAGA